MSFTQRLDRVLLELDDSLLLASARGLLSDDETINFNFEMLVPIVDHAYEYGLEKCGDCFSAALELTRFYASLPPEAKQFHPRDGFNNEIINLARSFIYKRVTFVNDFYREAVIELKNNGVNFDRGRFIPYVIYGGYDFKMGMRNVLCSPSKRGRFIVVADVPAIVLLALILIFVERKINLLPVI